MIQKKIVLLADPVNKSLSHLLQNFLLKKMAFPAEYSLQQTPINLLEETIQQLKSENFLGGNLSHPLKQAIIPLVDEMTPIAKSAQSINTIVYQEGLLKATTTDGEGFFNSWLKNFPAKELYFLGGGGATLAIINAANTFGVHHIFILQRKNQRFFTLEQKVKQLEKNARLKITLVPWTTANLQLFLQQEYLVQATTQGLKGENFLPPDFHFRSNQKVFDLIYAGNLTPFLQAAKNDGAYYQNGLGMLVEQGVLSFTFWTGLHIPADLKIQAYHLLEGSLQ
ncbi:shikimate dehydrogenase family protein [Enterococcus timonensis]|uniref:shikimate dehydrogenase family protein n=1 Tax=Enterococcus timonensis TaxID=1852364 RepID=UPI0008DB2624|nr:hypothetical protein [Enterococcus timonensis]